MATPLEAKDIITIDALYEYSFTYIRASGLLAIAELFYPDLINSSINFLFSSLRVILKL